MEQILGFAPDAPWGTPGAVQDCTYMVPYINGLEQAASWVEPAYDALAADSAGSFIAKASSTTQYYAGTATKLYRLNGTAWADVTRAVGGNYSAVRWIFTQFGDQTLACNQGVYTADPIQIVTTGTGAFADISTAIGARTIISATSSGGGFVLAFNTTDATYGTSPDRWRCCAINDATSWTISVATQATTGRLVGGVGAITAAANISGDMVAAFKATSLFVGQYVGPPEVWRWREISGLGVNSAEACCSIDRGVFFVNRTGLYIFDGTSVRSVSDGKCTNWWKENIATSSVFDSIMVAYVPTQRHVRIFHPFPPSTLIDNCLVYNVDTGTFGRDYIAVQDVKSVMAANSTSTPIWVFDTINDKIRVQSGTVYNAATMKTGYFGNDEVVSNLNQFKLRYDLRPKTSVDKPSVVPISYKDSGGSTTILSSVSSSDSPLDSAGIFKTRGSGRWFQGNFTFAAGDIFNRAKVVAVEADLQPRTKR